MCLDQILVFGSKYCSLGQNIGFGVKYGSLGQVRLVSQIWPSGQELGSQPQGPGSIPPSPLMGSLRDPCGIQPLC